MKRSKFSLSHYKLLTMDMGNLVPLTWFEALPGDTIQQATSCLIRFSPLLSPVMHPVRIRIHNWFVPYRLIWEDFEDFITGGPDGSSTPVHPYFDVNGNVDSGELSDYFGLPVGDYSVTSAEVSALPYRAYNLIFNEHYRDQDLQNELTVHTASGQDDLSAYALAKCSWEKDYFTTARPWEQKGEDILIPIGDSAPVKGIGKLTQVFNQTNTNVYETGESGQTVFSTSVQGNSTDPTSDERWHIQEDPNNLGFPSIYADLSQATGITVNELRQFLAQQRFMEARARYGSRYVEFLRYLGVRSSDARLQLPEYLGGGSGVVQFSEVLKTGSGDDPAEPIGTMKGHGINALRSRRYRRFFEEHGIVMTLASVVPKAIYMNGIPRQFLRKTKEDYFQKELQYLGDQQVQYREVNAFNSAPGGVFGYQARYDEYRSLPSQVAGQFNDVLDYWHYARKFSGDIGLNGDFVTCNPSKRPNADQVNHVMYVMSNHSIQARRLLIANARPRTF